MRAVERSSIFLIITIAFNPRLGALDSSMNLQWVCVIGPSVAAGPFILDECDNRYHGLVPCLSKLITFGSKSLALAHVHSLLIGVSAIQF